MFGTIFAGLVELVSAPIKSWSERKTLEKQQEYELLKLDHEAKVSIANAKLEMAKQGQIIDADLDKASMEDMRSSWKDEFVLMVFITPMILAFIPETAPYSLKGFEIVKEMPDWYVALIIGMVVVIYGMRGMLTKWLEAKINIVREVK